MRPRGLLVAVLVVVPALAGLPRIQADTSILAFFPDDGPTRTSVRTVEETLGGSSVIQVRVDGDILDPATLRALEAFQARAKELPEIGGAQSITHVLRGIHETLTDEDALPGTRQAAAQELLLYSSSGDASELAKLLTLDERSALAAGGQTEDVTTTAVPVVTFILGGLVGLFTIARVVRRALDYNRRATLAFLVALVVGALRAPVVEVRSEVGFSTDVLISFVVAAVVGAAFLLILDWYAVDLDLDKV
jgi:CBS domain-containing protein